MTGDPSLQGLQALVHPQSSGQKPRPTSRWRNYCDVCRLGPAPNPSLEGKITFNTIDQYSKSAQNGCRACVALLSFLIGHKYSGPYLIDSTELWSVHDAVRCEFFIGCHEEASEKQRSSCGHAPEHPSHLFPGSNPSGCTSSAKCFDAVQKWISRCQQEHTLCNSTKEDNLPHRVLEIQCLRPLRVRVVEGRSRHGKYACLSYRWGSQTKLKSLNTRNLSLYKAMIPRRNLYPLVRDAITIASKLRLRYIWIDAYCILQDRKEDWEKEAAEMGSVYERAFLTISATDSYNGRKVFSTIQPKSFLITEVNGESVFIRRVPHHPVKCCSDGQEELKPGTTLSRAWVYQERLLSRRFIHFTREEIFWECRQCTWCECGSSMNDWAQLRRGRPRMLENQPWWHITSQYDGTELTYEDDRLPALAGVAKRFAEIHGKTYLAGHWEEDLPSSLGWYKFAADELRPLS
jgi:hypothetical protein